MRLRIPRIFHFSSRRTRKVGPSTSPSSLERLLWGVVSSTPVASQAAARKAKPARSERKALSFTFLFCAALFLAQGLSAAQPAMAAADPAKVFYPAATPSLSLMPSMPAPGAKAPILTSVIYLIFLGGMGYVAYMLWRRKIIPQRTAAVKGSTLDVLTTRPLGNRQFLVVVKYNQQELLLGVGQGFITRLNEGQSHTNDLKDESFAACENLACGTSNSNDKTDKEVYSCKK